MDEFSSLGGQSQVSDGARFPARPGFEDKVFAKLALWLSLFRNGLPADGFVPVSLLKSFAALAAAPFVLAFEGTPSLAQALIFILLVLPLTGRALAGLKAPGQMLAAACNLSVTGAALILGLLGESPAAALIWLFAVPLESACASYRSAVFSSLAFFAAGAVILYCGARSGRIGFSETGLILTALIYAFFLSISFVKSQQKTKESALKKTDLVPDVTEMLGDVLITCDRSGAVQSVGNTCQILFNVAPFELIGRGFFEHVHVADRPAYLKAIADAAVSDCTSSAHVRVRTGFRRPMANGEAPVFIWLEMRARRQANSNEQLEEKAIAVAAVFRDISAAKSREAELEAVRLSSEEASLAKDHFLANVSHELRTPLNAIIGFSEMLADPQLAPQEPEKKREYASIIYHSGLHLLAVVNSILDMSKIQSGSFAVKPERFAILPLIDNVCDMMRLKAEESGLELTRAYLPGCDEIVSDKHACKQILLNLLSNALKFTPAPGQISVTAQPEGNNLLIAVSDSGIGISPRDLERLGNPFFQAQSAHDRPYEGTGLGLSIVRGLLGLQGGSIRVESEPGKGTCVVIRLPLDCRPFIRKTLSQGSDCPARRPFPEGNGESAGGEAGRIETLPRRSPDFVPPHQLKEMMVKKIA